MKNKEREDVPLIYINRSPVLLGVSVIVSAFLLYFNYFLFKQTNPWGFLFIVPTFFSIFHSIWLLLNPFALFYEDKFEVNQSLLQTKQRYFVDIQKIALSNKGQLILIYHDHEQERLSVFGIQKNKVNEFKALIEKYILASTFKH